MSRVCSNAVGVTIAALLIAMLGSRPQARQEPTSVSAEATLQDPERAATILRAMRDGLDHIPGELLIKFRPGTAPSAMQSVMAIAPASLRGASVRWIGDTVVLPMDEGAPAAA